MAENATEGRTRNVDARGLSCPQPVILTRNALLEAASGRVVVLVDTMTQVQNCTRAAKKLGWTATCEERGDTFELQLERKT
jgi:TusA-related sulfurtransferase